jgi:putative sigma-54 modulation protein
VRILITGRHVGVTEAMKDYAREKVGKLEKIFDRLTKVEVTMDVTHDANAVEIVVDANRGVRLVGKAEAPDMYAAIDLAEDKLARQLRKHKQRLTDHHRGEESMGSTPAPPPGDVAAASEDSYEQEVERALDSPPDAPPRKKT